MSEGTVKMKDGISKRVNEETLTKFFKEAKDGNITHHPECTHCGLSVDPDEAKGGPLHYGCWFENASVQERCETEAERGVGNRIASEAINSSEDPRQYLFDLIGNPVRSLHDRNDARHLLNHAVPSDKIIEAAVRCPQCREGETFEIDPGTGEVHCHCGKLLKSSD